VSGKCAGAAKCCVGSDPLPANAAAAVGKTMFFSLRTGSFPGSGYPDAGVYVPRAFNPSLPLNIVVFVHGWVNCIQNVVLSAGPSRSRCSPGGAARYAYGLTDQIETSGKNVLLVVPEISRDQNSGNPGQLGNTNGLRNMLNELLGEKLAPLFGAKSVERDVSRIIVFGHSAAYQTTSAWASQGLSLPQLKEIHMLDSCYGGNSQYQAWITAHKNQFANREYRYTNTYFESTAANSISQANTIKTIVPASVFFWDKAGVAPTTAMFATPVLFKASSVHLHDGIPATFIAPLLSQSAI